jgi:hypothetical protein
MRSSQDHVIVLQRLDALIVQVFVSNHIEAKILLRQPIGEMGIGRKMPEPGAVLIEEREIPRTHREDGPQARRQMYARTVEVVVVCRKSKRSYIIGSSAESMGGFSRG